MSHLVNVYYPKASRLSASTADDEASRSQENGETETRHYKMAFSEVMFIMGTFVAAERIKVPPPPQKCHK